MEGQQSLRTWSFWKHLDRNIWANNGNNKWRKRALSYILLYKNPDIIYIKATSMQMLGVLWGVVIDLARDVVLGDIEGKRLRGKTMLNNLINGRCMQRMWLEQAATTNKSVRRPKISEAMDWLRLETLCK